MRRRPPDRGCPSAVEELALDVGEHRERQVRSSSFSRRQARCTNSESVLTPSTCASRASNSLLSLPKPAISVGHTKVKSFGQKNTTFHLPLKLPVENGLKAFVRSLETTPVSENSGNFCPIPSMINSCRPAAPQSERRAGCQRQPACIQSIVSMVSIDAVYWAHGRSQAQGPALPGRGGGRAPLRRARRASPSSASRR